MCSYGQKCLPAIADVLSGGCTAPDTTQPAELEQEAAALTSISLPGDGKMRGVLLAADQHADDGEDNIPHLTGQPRR